MNFKILVITICSIIVLFSGCSDEYAPRESSASVSNYLSLMPEQTNILFYANCEKIRNTPFGDKFRVEWENKWHEDWEEDEYLDFKEETGLDLEKDIYEIWAGVLPGDGYDRENNGGAIIRGKFDQKRIIEYLNKEHRYKIDEETYKGNKIYIISRSHNKDFSLAFFDSDILLLGGDFWLRTVIQESKNGSGNILSNSTMTKHINGIPYKDHLWAIMDVNELTEEWADEIRKHGSAFKGTKSLENLKSLIFYSEIDERSKLFLKGDFTTVEEAQLVEETLIGLKAMAKLIVSDDREAIDMLNDIKISTQGSELEISTKVDKNFLDKFEQKRKRFKNQKIELL